MLDAPGSALDPIVRRKLASPQETSLSPAESRRCLVSCVAYGREQARLAEGRDVVVVLGNTGAGKSAFINYLSGCTFELSDEDRMVVAAESPTPEVMKIGHTNQSETFAPQVAPGGKAILMSPCFLVWRITNEIYREGME